MNYEAKNAPPILLERDAVPLIFDAKEGAYMPAPYTGKRRTDDAPTPQGETLPGYAAFRSRDNSPAPQDAKDKELDYKMLVSAVTIMGAMGMGILIIRTLYSFSPFVTVIMIGAGLFYAMSPDRKEDAAREAEPKVPRKIPRMVEEDVEEVTIFYYKSKNSKSKYV